MADKIGFTKDQLQIIYDQVTSQPDSGTRKEVSTSSDPEAHTGGTITSTLESQNEPTVGSDLGPGKEAAIDTALGNRNEVTAASDLAKREKSTTDPNMAHRTNIVAAADLRNQDESRRDSDVGPHNETIPEHHNHHHRDKADHHQTNDVKATTAAAADSSTNTKKAGIDYGNISHLGNSSTATSSTDQDGGTRRKSLAESPYRGRIDSTVSPPSPSKKWSFSKGDFGLKLPKQDSNAVTQQLNKDGSVSMQGGQGRVPRGIGSISSTVTRGSVDQTVSERDPSTRWSLTHGDFGLKFPRQESNAVAQELNRDGSVSSQGGQGSTTVVPPGVGAGAVNGANTAAAAGARKVSLASQGARGIGSISSSVRRGSVDASVSEHDKARKWSLKDADFGLKWPKQSSNLHE